MLPNIFLRLNIITLLALSVVVSSKPTRGFRNRHQGNVDHRDLAEPRPLKQFDIRKHKKRAELNIGGASKKPWVAANGGAATPIVEGLDGGTAPTPNPNLTINPPQVLTPNVNPINPPVPDLPNITPPNLPTPTIQLTSLPITINLPTPTANPSEPPASNPQTPQPPRIPNGSQSPTSQSPTLPNGPQSPTIPNGSQSPTLPNTAQSPALPNGPQSPTLPNAGQSPTLPNGVQSSSLPNTLQSPTLPNAPPSLTPPTGVGPRDLFPKIKHQPGGSLRSDLVNSLKDTCRSNSGSDGSQKLKGVTIGDSGGSDGIDPFLNCEVTSDTGMTDGIVEAKTRREEVQV